MRIFFISTMSGAPWGGSEELWSKAAQRLRQQGINVSASVIWWPQLSSQILELAKSGIPISFRNQHVSRALPIRLWSKIKHRFINEERKDFRWLRAQKADLVVISQGGNADGTDWMNFCRDNGILYASVFQANNEHWWPCDVRAVEISRAYKAAEKVFSVSKRNLELLERQIGEFLPNAEIVWNPYNISTGPSPGWPQESGIWKLACVARLEPAAKGQDLLFQVLAQKKWQERPVELNLYGAGPCEQNLRRLAGGLQLKNVFFRGHHSNMNKLWEENHILVLPSRFEGLPLALVEAMWCARPAVVTDIGGNTEVCIDEKTGFVAAAPTVELLDEALERAWLHRNQWQLFGQAARAQAEKLIPTDPIGVFCQQLLKLVKRSCPGN